MPPLYDIAVIGCGGMGSAVLYHAAQLGSRVLGLEQFDLVHDRGSSHGQTRIIRQAYFEHPNYVPLLLEAYDLWHALEHRHGQQLYFETGLLQVGPPNGIVVPGVLGSAALHRLDVDHFNRNQLIKRFPVFQFTGNCEGVFEKRAGYLRVEQCVQAHLDAAIQDGADIRPRHQLERIQTDSGAIRLVTSKGDFAANRVIFTVGSWMPRWWPNTENNITILKKHLHWYDCDDSFMSSRQCPAFLFETKEGCFYGFPKVDAAGLKVSEHSGGDPINDPGELNSELNPVDLQRIDHFLANNLHGHFAHRDHCTCMYTMTNDQHFWIDKHPNDERLLIAGGFSGHGFKFASVIGKLVAQWAVHDHRDTRLEFLGARPT